jgi:hypothetical protein
MPPPIVAATCPLQHAIWRQAMSKRRSRTWLPTSTLFRPIFPETIKSRGKSYSDRECTVT